MVTEQQLRDTLHHDVDHYGDGSNVLLSDILAEGRRRRRTSIARRAAGGVTALAVGGSAAFALASTPAAAASWTLAPAPEHVNQRIVELVEEQLPSGVGVSEVDLVAYTDPAAGQGSAEPGGIPLPPARWSDADAWRATLTLDTGTTIQVFLGHAEGETEGDADASCDAGVEAGAYTVCDAESVHRQGEDVDVIWREGSADRSPDGTLHGPGTLVAPDGAAAVPSTPVVTRELESQPGGDFLVSVLEITPSTGAPLLDRGVMADIALDAELLDVR
jgi:hypothetical protein